MVKCCRFFFNKINNNYFLLVVFFITLLLANNNYTKKIYFSLIYLPHNFNILGFNFSYITYFFVNNFLMTFLFFKIILELKYERFMGFLANNYVIFLPAFAALGGMLLPGLIFYLFNFNNIIIRHGWAIPTVTDIPFVICILSILNSYIPVSFRTFLLILSVFDDIIAILIIAIFYNKNISIFFLFLSFLNILFLFLLYFFKNKSLIVYLFCGLFLWFMLFKSGIHPTMTGLFMGLFSSDRYIINNVSLDRILYSNLRFFVDKIILPIFIFVNSGVCFLHIHFKDFFSFLFLGIFFGLFLGKPIGITFFSWVFTKLKSKSMLIDLNIYNILSAGIISGIGFTMSIFIILLSYNSSYDFILIEIAKLGVFLSSLVSGILGCLMIKKQFKKN
ncbi:Na+/H+ antiporter NhaA [Candidatus Purcelliella pentastirinorum]|uniref:Na(+)/H(+) antiporter NhaA n=1 Tax=Candidatus Purcelliella pentastirinorum TaxID=472834 RepID=A0AAX3NB24_9ENTR|nr:Na+/H+ antiporter NhaA [Candidatus Purcelliella pentastirinorum]WDI78665.1 Na+/H+ antiporter NhaA [Candidatus Purcelliella pentastirinorum]WDR80724.1 Na+/H+ antiporter NhaA [Candidatus Purcelliella pentastirinorum]